VKTKLKDPLGGHVRIYWTMLDSVAWHALSFSDQALYMAMRRKLLGSNNGNIEATLATLRHAGFTSPATLAKALRALQTMGFIAKTRQGGIASGSKLCCLYRFTDVDSFDHLKQGVKGVTQTNDWRQFQKLAHAKAVLKAAHLEARRPHSQKHRARSVSVSNRYESCTEKH